jgi:bifunctional DNA-binding transcriptional regulator/antitoxin component of YhaV-PrlF toxin-antitoxin module
MSTELFLDNGRLMVPKDYRERHGVPSNGRMLAAETRSGVLLLRPVRTPENSLLEHLKRLKGVEVPERKAHCRPRV